MALSLLRSLKFPNEKKKTTDSYYECDVVAINRRYL